MARIKKFSLPVVCVLVQFGSDLYFLPTLLFFTFQQVVLLLIFALHGAGGAYCLGFDSSFGKYTQRAGCSKWDLGGNYWIDCILDRWKIKRWLLGVMMKTCGLCYSLLLLL